MSTLTTNSVAASGLSSPLETQRQVTANSARITQNTPDAQTAAVTRQATTPVIDIRSSQQTSDDAASKEKQPSRQALDEAVKAVNNFVNSINNSLEFSIDDATGKTVVKVIDIETKEVIKQFPSEEVLAIAKALDGIKGLLVQQKA